MTTTTIIVPQPASSEAPPEIPDWIIYDRASTALKLAENAHAAAQELCRAVPGSEAAAHIALDSLRFAITCLREFRLAHLPAGMMS